MQHVPQRDGDHGTAQRGQQRAQLADARAVGPPAAPHVHGVAGLQHVAAVQRAWLADPGGAQAQRPGDPRDAVHLGPAGRRARTGQHGQVLADHHRIFDEDRVRAVLCGRHLPDHPAAGRQRLRVGGATVGQDESLFTVKLGTDGPYQPTKVLTFAPGQLTGGYWLLDWLS
jgi:hypothetical protein